MDQQGRVLIARRPEQVHQGGLWEFPGGKVDAGETLDIALKRELREELAVSVGTTEPLIRIRHDYPDKSVLLDVHRITHFEGTPRGNEGQPVRWVTPQDLGDYQFPAANRPIISSLTLPDRMLISGDADLFPAFMAKVENALAAGVRLFQLRRPDLTDESYRELAQEVAALCSQWKARLVCNRSAEVWARLPEGTGLHLNRWQLARSENRPVPDSVLLGASCHNLEEVRRACGLGVDYLTLSPVLTTRSHPHAVPLGWDRFAEWVEEATVPVYALGGMSVGDVSAARIRGAQGIAGIGFGWPA